MNELEDYLRISKNGYVHTLTDRISFNWKENLNTQPYTYQTVNACKRLPPDKIYRINAPVTYTGIITN